MREPWTQLYLHLVWSTWDRLPLISAALRPAIYACIQAECDRFKVDVIAIGGTEDHIHLLLRIPTTISVATIMKQAKGVSSHLANHELAAPEGFKWQGAYGAFTLSKDDVPRIREYILHQEEHHQNHSLNHEYEPVIPIRGIDSPGS
jgi:putative transposase